MNVVIVESAAKAKTINKYLGSGYKVIASFGHVRDLLRVTESISACVQLSCRYSHLGRRAWSPDRGRGVVRRAGVSLRRLPDGRAAVLVPEHKSEGRVLNRVAVAAYLLLDGSHDVEARSYLLLYRSRGDDRPADLVSVERIDRLRPVPGGWLLVGRDLAIDEAVLRTQNLALFL